MSVPRIVVTFKFEEVEDACQALMQGLPKVSARCHVLLLLLLLLLFKR